MLGTIKVSVDRMLNQVSDLLDSSKLEAGKFDISLSKNNINSIIADRVSVLNYDAETRKVKLESKLDPDIPEFEFDPDRIGQVVNNLISNALKFTKAGGTVTISSHVENGNVVVAVSDTGVGIPQDKKALLFSKYSQLESIAKSKGTGLGLYISKGIIEAHHGIIKLDSEVGKGTTVSFTIPLHSEKKDLPSVSVHTPISIPVQHLPGHPGNVVLN
jgi:signal transduction histidine kinase